MTSSEYVVWLDGDDVLEPEYFEAAAARLDRQPDLDFVSCAMRAFGAASYVWTPSPPTFVDAVSTGGVPHASTMLRRRVWETVGGFDERYHLYYEDVYSELIAEKALSAEVVDVADLPWTEVDDYSDLERARALIETGA